MFCFHDNKVGRLKPGCYGVFDPSNELHSKHRQTRLDLAEAINQETPRLGNVTAWGIHPIVMFSLSFNYSGDMSTDPISKEA